MAGHLDSKWGYHCGSPTAVQAWQPCPLWEPSPSHPILVWTRGFGVFCVYVCLFYVWFVCVLCVPSVLWYCWLGLLICKKNRRPYNLYCVAGDVKPCSIIWTVNEVSLFAELFAVVVPCCQLIGYVDCVSVDRFCDGVCRLIGYVTMCVGWSAMWRCVSWSALWWGVSVDFSLWRCVRWSAMWRCVDCAAVSWLQRPVNECHGLRRNVVPAGVHVPRHTSPAYLYE